MTKFPDPYGKLCAKEEQTPVAMTIECHCHENRLGIVSGSVAVGYPTFTELTVFFPSMLLEVEVAGYLIEWRPCRI